MDVDPIQALLAASVLLFGLGWLLGDAVFSWASRAAPAELSPAPQGGLTTIHEDSEEEGADEGETEPAHHAATAAQQQAAACYELRVMAASACLPAPCAAWETKTRAAKTLRAQGLVRLNGVVGAEVAQELLTHVNQRLQAALQQQQQQQQQLGSACEEPILGVTLCKQQRYDIKLDLRCPAVAAALAQAVAAIGPVVSQVLGPAAELFELGSIVADGGAARQPVHPDTPWSSRPSVCTAFIALQDVTESMGPTGFLPGTHTAAAHTAYNWGQPQRSRHAATDKASTEADAVSDRSEWARLLRSSGWCAPLLGCGDSVLFDSRLLHFAGENTSSAAAPAQKGRRRVLFYFSLRARGAGASWTGCGFEKPGTLLNELRGRYCLDRGQRALEERRQQTSGGRDEGGDLGYAVTRWWTSIWYRACPKQKHV